MRSSWQRLDGANNRLGSLAPTQESQSSLFTPKEIPHQGSRSQMYNGFVFGLQDTKWLDVLAVSPLVIEDTAGKEKDIRKMGLFIGAGILFAQDYTCI